MCAVVCTASGLVYLFDFLVVNNWQFLTSGLTNSINSEWARLYSVLFVLICVNVIMNLVIALVIDAFLSQWNRTRVDPNEGAEA